MKRKPGRKAQVFFLKNFLKIFKKTIDKRLQMCYNKVTK